VKSEGGVKEILQAGEEIHRFQNGKIPETEDTCVQTPKTASGEAKLEKRNSKFVEEKKRLEGSRHLTGMVLGGLLDCR
jgi:hypothetical protein